MRQYETHEETTGPKDLPFFATHTFWPRPKPNGAAGIRGSQTCWPHTSSRRCCCRLKTTWIVETYSEYLQISLNSFHSSVILWTFIIKSSLDLWWLMDHVDFFWINPIKNLNSTNGVWLDQILGQAHTHVAGSAIWRRFGCWSSLPIEPPATRVQQRCDIDITIHSI